MRTITIQRRHPKSEIRRLVRSLPGALSGNRADPHRLRPVFLAHLTHGYFSSIHASFLARSRGGVDEFHNRWLPLSPVTIRSKLRQRTKRAPHRRLDATLSSRQLSTWRKTYSASLKQLRSVMRFTDASQRARELAWKNLQTSGGGSVPIGIAKGDLEKSLRPSPLDSESYRPGPGQIARVSGTKLTLGTSVPHASHFNRKRPIMPQNKSHLSVWSRRAVIEARDGMVEHLLRQRLL